MAESLQRISVSAGCAFTAPKNSDIRKAVQPHSCRERKYVKNRVNSMTIDILGTYTKCNPHFRVVDKLPQRVLTNPSEGVGNNGADNEEANLICRVHDQIICADICYTILDLLGTGTFGQVFRCQKNGTKEVVAIKIIKNKAAYHSQGLLEIKIARLLNNTFDPKDERHIVRLLDSFEFNKHICLVFELLSMSLLDILTQNQFRGLPLSVVQRFTRQIIAAMVTLEEANIIHCDLKPENILLAPPRAQKVAVLPPAKRKSDEMLGSAGGKVADQNVLSKDSQRSSATTKNGGAPANGQNESSTQMRTTPPPALTLSAASSNNDTSDTADKRTLDASHAVVSPDGNGRSVTPEQSHGVASSSSRANGGGGLGQGTGAGGGRLSVWSDVKVIDLGSACFEGRTMYSYIQSRFYRSPEVLLGVPYNGAIDMWSLACVCAEMYLGLPLFPGVSQHNQLTRIIEMMGYPPDSLIEGRNGSKYFSKAQSAFSNSSSSSSSSSNNSYQSGFLSDLIGHQSVGQKEGWRMPVSASPAPQKYRLKTAEEYASDTNTEIPVLRKYLRYSKLDDVIMKCPLANKARMTADQKKEEMLRRLCFLNFLEGLFKMNPFERWTAKQAAHHPFITNAVFQGHFVPAVDPKINERKLAYLVSTQQKDIRNRNNLGHAVYTGEAMDHSSDGMHVFRPLQFRRLSEPLKMTLTGATENELAPASISGPSLHRGQPVRETDRLSSPSQSQMPYQPSSLPYNNNQYMQQQQQQQQQQYVHRQQAQQQQYAELIQTPPEQYSAYSASTPDGAWASYIMKEQAGGTLGREMSNSQYIDALVQANSQAAALIRSRNSSSCDDLPSCSMTGKKSIIKQGGDAYDNASFSRNVPIAGEGQFSSAYAVSNRNQPQQKQQQQRPFVHGDNVSGSLPHARKLSGSHQRYDHRHNQNNRMSPQSYQPPSSLLLHNQSREKQTGLVEQQHFITNHLTQTQHPPQSMQSQLFPPSLDSFASGHPRMMSGSMDSSNGSNFETYGGSMTDVPMMMTDFGQALMRPDLDERRRLHSMQPIGGMGGMYEQYERQKSGQLWQNQGQPRTFPRTGLAHQSSFPQQQQSKNQHIQPQHQQQQQQQQQGNQWHTQSLNKIPNQRQNHGQSISHNQNQNQNQCLSYKSSSGHDSDAQTPEMPPRGQQVQSKATHAASSSGGPSSRVAGEDNGRTVSFAPANDYLKSETHNYVAQLIVSSRSISGFVSSSASPGRVEGTIGRVGSSGSAGSPGAIAVRAKMTNGNANGNGKGVGDVADILADWDPFFSADDFEGEEVEGEEETRGRHSSYQKKEARVALESGRSGSAGMSDKGSTDDGDIDPDVDESEWRSAGSRGNSADANPTPDLPYRKIV